jgi:predicted GNAT superfamily acetyltransferase
MKKTTYLANNIGTRVHAHVSLATANAKRRAQIDEKLSGIKALGGVAAINNTFDQASKYDDENWLKSLKHNSNPNLTCEYALPLLPFVETWGSTLIHAEIPAPKVSKGSVVIDPSRIARGLISDVERKANQHRLECNVLVPPPNSGVADLNSSSVGYVPIQQYDLEVIPLRTSGTNDINYVLCIDQEHGGVWYHPLASKVSLSTGRPPVTTGERPVKRRRMNAKEEATYDEETSKVAEAEGDVDDETNKMELEEA